MVFKIEEQKNGDEQQKLYSIQKNYFKPFEMAHHENIDVSVYDVFLYTQQFIIIHVLRCIFSHFCEQSNKQRMLFILKLNRDSMVVFLAGALNATE